MVAFGEGGDRGKVQGARAISRSCQAKPGFDLFGCLVLLDMLTVLEVERCVFAFERCPIKIASEEGLGLSIQKPISSILIF